jgi:hypothetical protein
MSSVVPLGRLQKVELRDAWPHEAGNFTPWLAQPENLTLLAEVLGIELAFEAIEKPVESFSADILAKDIATDRWVLIENQLEQTDHTHLGQILTYAAGLDAQTIVWIAKEFREPHRAAIDYLNHISAPEFNFFGVQVELFRIGDSALAPSFNVVAKPNDWSKQILAKAGDSAETTARHEYWQTYWSGLFEFAEYKTLQIGPRKPPKEGWFRIEQLVSGEPNAAIWLHCSGSKLRAVFWLQGQGNKELFDTLYAAKSQIEATMSAALVWDRMDNKKSSMIALESALGQFDTDNLAAHYTWFMDKAKIMSDALRPHLSPV